MSAKSQSIQLTLKSPSPAPSAVEKGTNRQQECKPVEHPAHFHLNSWQKTDSLENRTQRQPFPFPAQELSNWWFGHILNIWSSRDDRNVPGWWCIHARLWGRRGPLSSESSATLEVTVTRLKLPDCLYNVHIHVAGTVMPRKSVKWHHGRHVTYPCHISQINRFYTVTSNYRHSVFTVSELRAQMPLCHRTSLGIPCSFWPSLYGLSKDSVYASPHIPGASDAQNPKARLSHQGRIFRL